MTIWKLLACVPLIVAGSVAHAVPDGAEVQEILKKNACLACHAVDKKVLGPGYREIAAKHEGDADAAKVLAQHVRDGSVGVWGQVPMPPNPAISDDDLEKVIEWVLAGAPD